MSKIDDLKQAIDSLACEQRKGFTDLNGRMSTMEGMITALPLHPSPCPHEHKGYSDSIDSLNTRVNLWGGANSLGVILAGIIAVFRKP